MMKKIKKVPMIDGKTLKKIAKNSIYGAFRLERPAKIEVGDWVKYTWGRGQFTITVVASMTGATPQAIEAHPELHDLKLYHLSNGACLRAEAFVEVRKPS